MNIIIISSSSTTTSSSSSSSSSSSTEVLDPRGRLHRAPPGDGLRPRQAHGRTAIYLSIYLSISISLTL